MYRKLALVVLGALTLALAFTSGAARADKGAWCWSDPIAGPPGTTFTIYCSGFSANTLLNTYAVEPDGRAVSGERVTGFSSTYGNGSVKADANGDAMFWWHSQSGPTYGFSHQIGDWTWVVQQLGPTQSIAAAGKTTVTIQSVSSPQWGAWLEGSSVTGRAWSFHGWGFLRDEYVNIWVTLPWNCSGRANVEAAAADDPSTVQGVYDGFSGPGSVKANEQGEIWFDLDFGAQACLGFYKVTAYAPGSGYGAIHEFQVKGNSITQSVGQGIAAVPDSVSALHPYFALWGWGWDAWEQVNCYSTRADGRSFNLGTVKADASGAFAWENVHVSGYDSFAPFASEEPGMWSLTCNGPGTGHRATTGIMLYGLQTDP